ncbi:MAG: FAD-dependent oxidoreductase [Rhodopirellula sp.]|nr:FAD-dependent oxidoreductase [Rhodopirellula sp.]
MQLTRRDATRILLGAAAGFSASPAALAKDAAEEQLRTQVCVVGGGSGGIGAALAAARAGADVVLLERESILGGTSTCAWVHSWEPVSGADGIPRELYESMKEDPLAVTYPDYGEGAMRRGGRGLPFEPRALNYAAREMLEATGRCRVLLGTTYFRARRENDRIVAVEAWFAGKRLSIAADVFIDGTADGDLSVDVGCDFHIGEDPKSRYGEPTAPEEAGLHLNGLTLCYRIADTGVQQKPYLPKGVEEGICRKPVHIVEMANGDLLLNPVGMIDGNAIVQTEYSELMREAHRRVLEHFYWLQRLPADDDSRWTRHVRGKGFATWAIVGVAPRIGVRETRRILGDYVLNEKDCQAGVSGQGHNDIIAISDHAVDIHGSKGRLYEVPNGPYGVPYRCLLPRGVENLMIASRAASFSHIAASSCRLSRTMMTLGQAAGNAAALAVGHRVALRQVDIGQLQSALKSQGVAVST